MKPGENKTSEQQHRIYIFYNLGLITALGGLLYQLLACFTVTVSHDVTVI